VYLGTAVSARTPRRSPTQKRAKVTVDFVLTATDQVLRDRGLAGLSMRAVADRAGVSMGTLYHYFASKEALLAAWEERGFEAIRQQVFAYVERLMRVSPPLEIAVYGAVDTAIVATSALLAAYPVGDAETFFSRTSERTRQKDLAMSFAAAALAGARSQTRVRPSDLHAAAFVTINTILYLARELAFCQLEAERLRAVRHQATLMIVHTLVKDADESLLQGAVDPFAERQPGLEP
jgi:AcrR family transcriptional regulator